MAVRVGSVPPGSEAAPEHVTGYRDLALVGRGGFSVVYRARQEAFEREVALKVLTVGVDEDARRRFLREVRLTGALTGHPHAVTLLDAGMTWAGRPYLATEFFANGSLRDRVAARGPLPGPEVARVGAKIADALAAAHGLGIVHRDVKPNNILLSRFGEPALADFGVACLIDPADRTAGPDAFTPNHVAPETLNGTAPDASCDIYALGSTLYELLTGHPAFELGPGGFGTLINRVLTEDLPSLPGEPGSPLAAVIRTAMAKRPEDRFPDAAAMAEALRRAAGPAAPDYSPVADKPGSETNTLPITLPAPVEMIPQPPPGDSSALPTALSTTPPPVPDHHRPWERPINPGPSAAAGSGPPNPSMTMLRAERALAAEPVAPEKSKSRLPIALVVTVSILVGGTAVYLVKGVGKTADRPAATAPPPTSSAPSAPSAAPEVLDGARPKDVAVTDQGTTAKVDWHIAPGNADEMAVQIQSALAGSQPQLRLAGQRVTSYTATGLDPKTGYCFRVGAVVAFGAPSQISWSAPACIRGAVPVTRSPAPSASG